MSGYWKSTPLTSLLEKSNDSLSPMIICKPSPSGPRVLEGKEKVTPQKCVQYCHKVYSSTSFELSGCCLIFMVDADLHLHWQSIIDMWSCSLIVQAKEVLKSTVVGSSD